MRDEEIEKLLNNAFSTNYSSKRQIMIVGTGGEGKQVDTEVLSKEETRIRQRFFNAGLALEFVNVQSVEELYKIEKQLDDRLTDGFRKELEKGKQSKILDDEFIISMVARDEIIKGNQSKFFNTNPKKFKRRRR